jgi:hypothetical protein
MGFEGSIMVFGRFSEIQIMVEKFEWGTVKITGGHHKGRIGYYDDDDDDNRNEVVYFGNAFLASGYFLIPHKHLASITTSDLIKRHEEIYSQIGLGAPKVSDRIRADLLTELSLIDNELAERWVQAKIARPRSKKVFISHSSKDKQFARWLSVDLGNVGHDPWLDEWKIRVGESIPLKVSEGIETCDAMIVVLSESAMKSKWVENEWHAKYWEEIEKSKVMVLPALLQQCEIPVLLKTKKYADFRHDYASGLEDLLVSLGEHTQVP